MLATKHSSIESEFEQGVRDSPCCVSGSQDGTVHVWSAETGECVTVLDGGHPGPTYCAQFNPKLMMMVTACTSMVSPTGPLSGWSPY